MRLVLTSHLFLPDHGGGTEVLTLATARELQRRGHDVVVCTGRPVEANLPDESRFDEYEHDGVHVHRYSCDARPASARPDHVDPVYGRWFGDFLRRSSPDVVHFFHLGNLSASAIDACVEADVPTVMTATDYWLVCPNCQLRLPDDSPCAGPDENGVNCIRKYLELHHRLHGLDYRVLRLANPFGERQRVAAAQGAVTIFLDRALRGEEIEIWGDGSVVRDYFHVSDAAAALALALTHEGSDRVFNVGSGRGLSLVEVIEAVEALVGTRVRRRHLPPRPFDVPASVLRIDRAQEHLGWSPRVSFAEGLARTASWLREAFQSEG